MVIALIACIVLCTFFTSIAGFFTAKFKMHPFISTMANMLVILDVYKRQDRDSSQNECIRTEFDIKLLTGRHHQIRLQLANIGYPLIGDTKYGKLSLIHISRR